jgi:hypothetical protein
MGPDPSPETRVNNDARVTEEERSLFRLVAYFLVAWVLLSELGRRVLPELIGLGGAAFLVTLGAWCVDRGKSRKIAFPVWVVVSVAVGILVATVAYLLARLWPVA